MNTCKIAKRNSIGDPSAKYGYSNGGDKFVEDLEKHKERGEFLYNEFKSFMMKHNVDPRTFRSMFLLYWEEFLQ